MILLYSGITATDKKVLSRVTSLELSCSRLWVGTGNGNIISIPLNIGEQDNITATNFVPIAENVYAAFMSQSKSFHAVG